MCALTPKSREILDVLRATAEGSGEWADDGTLWLDVCFDHALPDDMTRIAFGTRLAELERERLVIRHDGGASGLVRVS